MIDSLSLLFAAFEATRESLRVRDGFDLAVHRSFNVLWLIQAALCFLASVILGRWLPDPLPPLSLFSSGSSATFSDNSASPSSSNPSRILNLLLRQFKLMLIIHSIFYIAEIALTNIYGRNYFMFLHHVFALVIFGLILLHENLICALTVKPFVLHALYWVTLYNDTVSEYTSWMLLFVYNVSLFSSGIIISTLRFFFNNERLSVVCGYVAATETFINAGIYCTWYPDTPICPPGIEGWTYLVYMSVFTIFCAILFINVHVFLMNRLFSSKASKISLPGGLLLPLSSKDRQD